MLHIKKQQQTHKKKNTTKKNRLDSQVSQDTNNKNKQNLLHSGGIKDKIQHE